MKNRKSTFLISIYINYLRAVKRTGIAAADSSRIRNADLGRFTIDRLMGILNRLGARIEVSLTVRHNRAGVSRYASAYKIVF
jgi:hypothetical protein